MVDAVVPAKRPQDETPPPCHPTNGTKSLTPEQRAKLNKALLRTARRVQIGLYLSIPGLYLAKFRLECLRLRLQTITKLRRFCLKHGFYRLAFHWFSPKYR